MHACATSGSRGKDFGPRTARQSPVMPMARMFWALSFWRTLNADRLPVYYLCRHLAGPGALFERFKSGLSDLVVMALSVLNHKYCPYHDVQVDLTQEKLDYIALGVYGANDSYFKLSLIIENYKSFFPASLSDVSGNLKQAHGEWTSIRRLIVSLRKPALMLMPFKQLWARMRLRVSRLGSMLSDIAHCAVPSRP